MKVAISHNRLKMSTGSQRNIQSNVNVISKSVESEVYKTLKFQNSSTKFQINLKFQYPMTKTFTAVVPYRCTQLYPSVTLPFGSEVGVLPVWNFEFWSLEFVWDLVFGAWNFHWTSNFRRCKTNLRFWDHFQATLALLAFKFDDRKTVSVFHLFAAF